MNDSTNKSETPRQYKFNLGRAVTYGLPVFLLVHVLGLFLPFFDWIWHFPNLVSLLASLAIGFVLHWLVFTYGPKAKKAVN